MAERSDHTPLDEAAAWLAKAEQDLLAARLLFAASGPSTVGCYLCQQAIEKAQKATLVRRGAVPPKTHDLVHLDQLVRAHGDDIGLGTDDLVAWRAYAVASRYPGFGDAQSETDFPLIIASAERALEHVRALLQTHDGSSG